MNKISSGQGDLGGKKGIESQLLDSVKSVQQMLVQGLLRASQPRSI